MGKPAVVGASGLEELALNEGVEISIDGATGEGVPGPPGHDALSA